MKKSGIISLCFSIITLAFLVFNFIEFYYIDNGVDELFYPRDITALFFELFIFFVLALSSYSISRNNNINIVSLHLSLVYFILIVAFVFLFLKGSYGNYSEFQTKLIGILFLGYSVFSCVTIWSNILSRNEFHKLKKIPIILYQLFFALLVFLIWVYVGSR